MKKLFTFLVLTVLLTGCTTASDGSFLDEKIKCKKLAEARFEELETGWGYSFTPRYSNYSPELDTCLINYVIQSEESPSSYFTDIIEDIATNIKISKFVSLKDDTSKNWTTKRKSFESQLDLYFGKDTE
ncbi:membrane lipoprotein lipid attachment site-containing protein [Patescibacteria group bacterium]|nr:membrane lipoprotein lipid attachment site-containing protein [Patescibacteria group bacterium]